MDMHTILTLELFRKNNSVSKNAKSAIGSVELLLPNHTEIGAMAKQNVYIIASIPFVSFVVFFIKKNNNQLFVIAIILCPQKIELFLISANIY